MAAAAIPSSWPQARNIKAPPCELKTLVEYCLCKGEPIIIGAHHTMWSSDHINERGTLFCGTVKQMTSQSAEDGTLKFFSCSIFSRSDDISGPDIPHVCWKLVRFCSTITKIWWYVLRWKCFRTLSVPRWFTTLNNICRCWNIWRNRWLHHHQWLRCDPAHWPFIVFYIRVIGTKVHVSP